MMNLKTSVFLIAIAGILQLVGNNIDAYIYQLMVLAGINALLAVSLNLVNGITGQFSLGHAGFMAVGAYAAAAANVYLFKDLNASSFFGSQAALVLSLGIAAGTAALAGFLVGLPSLRLRGDYLAIVTLGFGEIIRVVILNFESLGGARGFIGIPFTANAFWVYLILGGGLVACHRYMNSTHGRALLAIREDEIAAESMGVDTVRYKVIAFVASSAAAGVAGGLFAHTIGYLNPSSFTFLKSVEVVIMVVMGGMGSMTGALLAGIALTLLPEALRPLQQLTGIDLRMVIYSLALIGMMLWRPKGIFGKKEIWDYFRKKS